jgi:hypothetical protein
VIAALANLASLSLFFKTFSGTKLPGTFFSYFLVGGTLDTLGTFFFFSYYIVD